MPPVFFGLLAESHEWKAPASTPKENIRDITDELERDMVQAPREGLDLLCVPDLGTWDRITMVLPEKFLKPDAFVLASLKGSKYVTAFWVEVDLGSEPIWRVRDKVKLYAQFKKSNQLGPRGIMPAILVTTHTERRRDAIRRAIDTNVWGHKEQWQGSALATYVR